MSDPYTFERQGRSKGLALIILVVWCGLAYLWAAFDAAPWILGILAVFTLPGLSDLLRNPHAGLTLTDQDLAWYTGRRRVDLSLEEVDHVRLDTRLDFSVRATAVLRTGRKLRLPFEATPPHMEFEAALEQRGVRTERHHFTLMQ